MNSAECISTGTPTKESREPSKRSARPYVLIALASLILTIAAGAICYWIETTYYSSHRYFNDAAYYQYQDIQAFIQIHEQGRWSALKEVVHNDWRGPLRRVLLIAFAPSLLAQPLGHMATALLFLLAFVGLLGATVLRRSGSMLAAVAAMTSAVALPGLYAPIFGIAAYWRDLPAGLLIGAASLTLLNADRGPGLRWLVAFSLLVAFAQLSRFVSGAFSFVACAPLLLSYCVARLRRGASFWDACVIPIGLVGTIVFSISGWFIVRHYGRNFTYYTQEGYGWQSILDSSKFTIGTLIAYCSGPCRFLLILAAAGLLYLISTVRTLRDIIDATLRWWLPGSVVFFLSLTQLVGWCEHATLYAVPLLLIALLVPATKPAQRWDGVFKWTAGSLAVIAALIAIHSAVTGMRLARTPSATERDEKQYLVALAEAMYREGKQLSWATYFDQVTSFANLECFYRHGCLLHPEAPGFGLKESHIAPFQAEESPEQFANTEYTNARKSLGIAVVCADPMIAGKCGTTPYSSAIAHLFAVSLPNDPQWQLAFTVQSDQFGTLHGYRNLAVASDARSQP